MVDMEKNYKKGFSLVGVIVLLLMVFFMMAIMAPLITKKHQTSTDGGENENGMYVCYRDGEKIFEQYFSNGNAVSGIKDVTSSGGCNFQAPSNVERINIQLVGGGAGGGGIPCIYNGGDCNVYNNIEDVSYSTGYLPNSIFLLNEQINNAIQGQEIHDDDSDGVLFNFLINDGGVFNNDGSYKYGTIDNKPIILRPKCIKEQNVESGNRLIGRQVYNISGNTNTYSTLYTGGFFRDIRMINNYTTEARRLICDGNGINCRIDNISGYSCTINSSDKDDPYNAGYSPIPYLKFDFIAPKIRLYSGPGGASGKTVSHITTNLSGDFNISLGRGGAGGNCGASGNFVLNDCIGGKGEDSLIEINGRVLRAEGGDNEGRHFETESHILLPDRSYDLIERSSTNSKIRGKRSGLHGVLPNNDIPAGDGGHGAGLRFNCEQGRLQTRIFQYGHRGETNPTNGDFMAGTLFKDEFFNTNIHGSRCRDNFTSSDNFIYVRTNSNGDNVGTDGANSEGQPGQGGAVIITW